MSELHEMRFSDEQLQRFLQEFIEFRDQQERKAAEDAHRIEEMTETLNTLVSNTEDLVTAWRATQGAVKVAAWVGNTLKWVSGVAAAFAAIWYLFHGGTPK